MKANVSARKQCKREHAWIGVAWLIEERKGCWSKNEGSKAAGKNISRIKDRIFGMDRQSFVEYAALVDQALVLGESLLLFATRTRQKSSSSRPSAGFQVDQDHLLLLADQHTLQ